jgi:hypothetical protein
MSEERSCIDPEGCYPSDGFTVVEKNAARVLDLFTDVVVEHIKESIHAARESGVACTKDYIHYVRKLDSFQSVAVERTRDCIQLSYDNEEGIVILVTAEAIELRLPTVEWTMGSYGPVASSRLWKRVDWCEITDTELISLLNDALKQRKNEFRICRYCGRKFPLEHMHANDVCQGCAEKHLGVVY